MCVPSILRTFFLYPQSKAPVVETLQYKALFGYVDACLSHINYYRYIERFCRARPEEVVDYLCLHLKRLLEMDSYPPEVRLVRIRGILSSHRLC
jgi:hypothetical protein